jgi:GMP synthase (glutamine-hydrolysing)
VELAANDVCLQAYRVGESAWGIQFHAEVTRENAEVWISRYDTDPNAVAAGFDPDAARRELAERIGEWNQIGRTLAGGFVEQVEALRDSPARRATA